MTLDEFLDLPEMHTKLEYVDGEVFVEGLPLDVLPVSARQRILAGEDGVLWELGMNASPNLLHEKLVGELTFKLRVWAFATHAEVDIHNSIDVLFKVGQPGRKRSKVYRPDIAIWSPTLSSTHMPITETPAICVEVLSANRTFDKGEKRLAYQDAGVLEYWVVDPLERQVEVYKDGWWDEPCVRNVLVTTVLDGLRLEVVELFAVAMK